MLSTHSPGLWMEGVMERKPGGSLVGKKLGQPEGQDWRDTSLRRNRSAGSIEDRHSETLLLVRSCHLRHRRGWGT